MTSPQLSIVSDPRVAEPVSGSYAQITFDEHGGHPVFGWTLWTVRFASKVDGVRMPDVEEIHNIRVSELVSRLDTWADAVGPDKYIYVTKPGGLKLVPELVRPRCGVVVSDSVLSELIKQTIIRYIQIRSE